MKRGCFYGYNIVAAGFLIQATAIAAMFTYGVFFKEFQVAFMVLTALALIGLVLIRSLRLPADASPEPNAKLQKEML